MSTQTTRQSSGILVSLAACMALQMTGFVMILPLFARRFESFGAGVEALGVSAMAYALTSTFAAPFVGMLADRYGRQPIILFSLAGDILAFSGYRFAASAWVLILLRGLAGVFTAGLLPAIMSIVGDLAPENWPAQWIGIVNGGAAAGWIQGTAGSLGNLLGPALVVLFTPFASPQVVFLMATALVVALTLASGLVLRLPESAQVSHQFSNTAAAR